MSLLASNKELDHHDKGSFYDLWEAFVTVQAMCVKKRGKRGKVVGVGWKRSLTLEVLEVLPYGSEFGLLGYLLRVLQAALRVSQAALKALQAVLRVWHTAVTLTSILKQRSPTSNITKFTIQQQGFGLGGRKEA